MFDIDIDIDLDIRCAFFLPTSHEFSNFSTVAEARVGVELDSDQFVGPGVDYMPLELQVFRSRLSGVADDGLKLKPSFHLCRFEMTKKEKMRRAFFGFCFHFLLLQFVALK